MGVAVLLVVMSYTIAYFGVLTPDRVVRYRMLRFFMRGPVVAILVILAVQTVPTVERVMGSAPRYDPLQRHYRRHYRQPALS